MTIQDKIYNYFEVNERLHVLFIFDDKIFDGIASELEPLEWKPGYRYEVFDGRYFTTKYKLAHDWAEEKVVLLFPGMPEQTSATAMASFALSGEMTANMVFHNESYLAFMQQHNIPTSFAALIERHVADLQLAKMEKIMAEYYTPGQFSADICHRGLLSSFLKQEKMLSWTDILMRVVIILGLESEKSKRDSLYKSLSNNSDTASELSAKFESVFGRALNTNSPEKAKETIESFKYNAITQNLDAVASDDYKGYKTKSALSHQSLNNFITTVQHHPLKSKFNEAVSTLGEGIKESQIIKWYGTDADYALVTDNLCGPIIEKIAKEQIVSDPVGANDRLRRLYLKLEEGSPLIGVIDYLNNVCIAYSQIKDFGTYRLKNIEEYIYKYKTEFYLIDMSYRHAVKAFNDILESEIKPSVLNFEVIRALKAGFEIDYAKAVNELNIEWMKCVNESSHSLASHQAIKHQQNFYKDNIENLPTKVAVIVSDALRYEVAAELMQELGAKIHTANLDIAMAMVPTETKYCKDSILPHTDLSLQGDTMFVNGKEIKSTSDRTTQLRYFKEDGICIQYEDFSKMGMQEKRDLCKRSVVYIYHDTVDSMSHKNPKQIGTACEIAIRELKDLISSLHATCNVTNVILTADHGFLYNDMEFAEKDKHKITEDTVELKTRYYISNDSSEASAPGFGISKFPVSKVSGMSGSSYVAVPNGSNRLYAAGGGYEFAHGGATLQEILIPVLFSYRQKVDKKLKVDVTLLEPNLALVSSQLAATLIQAQAVSSDKKERTVLYGLYQGNDLVSEEKRLVLESSDAVNYNNRMFKVNLMLNKPTSAAILEFRVYDIEDKMNPLIKANVQNKTLIEQDF